MKNRIREIRKQKGYTQVAVQLETGIDQSLLSKYESFERIPTTEALVHLSDLFNVSIDYILCRTNNPDINK